VAANATPNGAGYSPAPNNATLEHDAGRPDRRPKPSLRFLRRLADVGAGSQGEVGKGSLDALEAELALLREENARLRAEQASAPPAGQLIELVRGLGQNGHTGGDVEDEAWQVLSEVLVMRNVLADICQEVSSAMNRFEDRLRSLDPSFPAAPESGDELAVDMASKATAA
jgi:hypothetical protein